MTFLAPSTRREQQNKIPGAFARLRSGGGIYIPANGTKINPKSSAPPDTAEQPLQWGLVVADSARGQWFTQEGFFRRKRPMLRAGGE